MFDCIGYCASPKAPAVDDWRFAKAKPLTGDGQRFSAHRLYRGIVIVYA